MFKDKVIEPIGFILAGATAIFSLLLFYYYTGAFWGSASAAIIAAAWVWMTYVILRWVLLAIRK